VFKKIVHTRGTIEAIKSLKFICGEKQRAYTFPSVGKSKNILIFSTNYANLFTNISQCTEFKITQNWFLFTERSPVQK
jgi:hypothetical protein